MSGLPSRQKGVRVEPAIAISRTYQARHDLELPLGADRMLRIEVKRRATGFAQLYDWLNDRDVLIGKADWQEPSVVLRMWLAAEIARARAESFDPSGDAA